MLIGLIIIVCSLIIGVWLLCRKVNFYIKGHALIAGRPMLAALMTMVIPTVSSATPQKPE